MKEPVIPVQEQLSNREKKKLPWWMLLIAIVLIVLQVGILYFSYIRDVGETVYFLFAKIASNIFCFSIPFFCLGMMFIPIWIFSRIKSTWYVDLLGVISFLISFIMGAFYVYVILFSSNAIGEIKELRYDENLIFYTIQSNSFPWGVNHYFCESTNNGYSGKCIEFAHSYYERAETEFFIDDETGRITIVNEATNGKWVVNTDPPLLRLTYTDLREE